MYLLVQGDGFNHPFGGDEKKQPLNIYVRRGRVVFFDFFINYGRGGLMMFMMN